MFWQKKVAGGAVKSVIISNQELTKKLHNSVNKKTEKRKAYSSFKDNIWSTDLANFQFIIKFHKGYLFILSVSRFYSKYEWVFPLKNRKKYYNY